MPAAPERSDPDVVAVSGAGRRDGAGVGPGGAADVVGQAVVELTAGVAGDGQRVGEDLADGQGGELGRDAGSGRRRGQADDDADGVERELVVGLLERRRERADLDAGLAEGLVERRAGLGAGPGEAGHGLPVDRDAVGADGDRASRRPAPSRR